MDNNATEVEYVLTELMEHGMTKSLRIKGDCWLVLEVEKVNLL